MDQLTGVSKNSQALSQIADFESDLDRQIHVASTTSRRYQALKAEKKSLENYYATINGPKR